MISNRQAKPMDDAISCLVHSRIDDESINDDAMLGLLTLLFLGGLDSVTAALTFQFRHLALNPDLQKRLRDTPEDVPKAIEELLRLYGQSVNSRRATADRKSVV